MNDLEKIIESGDELALIGWCIGMIFIYYFKKLMR
jgi:hypothetical protein